MQFHMMTLFDVLGRIRFSIPGYNLRYPDLVCKKMISVTVKCDLLGEEFLDEVEPSKVMICFEKFG